MLQPSVKVNRYQIFRHLTLVEVPASFRRLSSVRKSSAADLFAAVLRTPAVQTLQRRLESGRALSCAGVSNAAQPFLAALLRRLFPERPIIVVTEGVKAQERMQQDLETWLSEVRSAKDEGRTSSEQTLPSPLAPRPSFYPAWEVLPHEPKLPHADVISERLETLVALAQHAAEKTSPAPTVVTTVAALLQQTFPAREITARTRTFQRGETIAPLDLVEWLEDQGYDPEAKVTQKGELSLRGGILDVYPLTSPWPVRLEFFGDQLESLRYFDPSTQISRDGIESITVQIGRAHV